MNNKGFAASTIIYMLIIVFSILIFSSVVLNTNANKIEGQVVEEAKNLLNIYSENDLTSIKTKVYRYVTADGTWSSWIEYTSKADIDHTVALTNLTNTGGLGNAYDLDPTDLNLVIENGVSYLDFNGTTSKADGPDTAISEVVAQTIYIKLKGHAAIIADSSTQKLYTLNKDGIDTLGLNSYTNSLNNETFTLSLNGGPRIGTTQPFGADEEIIAVYIWDSNLNSYFMFINGVKNQSRIDYDTFFTVNFDQIDLGYNSTNSAAYTNIDLYDIAFSSQIISSNDALEVSAGNLNIESAIDPGNMEVRYGDYIQYSEYIEDTSEIIAIDQAESPTFDARYIKDYVKGSNISTGNHWVEIKANALYNDGDIVGGVEVGGTYTGSIVKNQNADGSFNNGKIRVTAGTYTAPDTNIYTMATDERIVTMFDGTTYSSAFLMFIGSHPGDFLNGGVALNTNDSSDLFVVAKYFGTAWKYDNNAAWVEFTPSADDYIVGRMEKYTTDTGITSVGAFIYPFKCNMALGRSGDIVGYDGASTVAISNAGRIVDGDLTTTNYSAITATSDPHIIIDLLFEAPIKEVEVWHYYSDSRTYYNTKTILENEVGVTKTIYDYNLSGTYAERSSGLTFPVVE